MNSKILHKKYAQYLLPSIITSLSLALNEFVDGCLVSNLLGSDALAIINLTCPVILMIAALFILFSSGGSVIYAINLGKWKEKEAGKVFSASMILAVVSGILFTIIGFLLKEQVGVILCSDAALREQMFAFYDILLLSAPIQISMLTFISFLPASGAPGIASVVNLVANTVNLLMDIVYIKIFGFGVEGAAYATITGYIVGALVMFILMKRANITIKGEQLSKYDGYLYKLILAQGTATALIQVCYAIKYTYSNQLAFTYGGRNGVVAFALCLQTFSIASVFLLGVADTAQPLLAILYGQRDYEGQRVILRKSFLLQILFSLLLIALLEAYPQGIARLYGVTDTSVYSITDIGIRIFAFSYLPRAICIQFMRFFQIEEKRYYALFISFFDGIAVIPLGFYLCKLMGLNGVFLSYVVCAILLFIIIFAVNNIIFAKSRDEYSAWSLIRKAKIDEKKLYFIITNNMEDISVASEKIQDFCSENGVAFKIALKIGLLCEEMAVYTVNHRKDSGDIDLMLIISDNEITLDFRSIGVPFDPNKKSDDDVEENIVLLQKIASEISYNYIMGMNNTRIRIERE